MKSKDIARMGLLLALHILLTRLTPINLPMVRISFGFLPLAVMGMLYGAIPTAVVAVIGDLIGVTVFPAQGAPHPGFTLSALLVGLTFGLLLHNHGQNKYRIALSAFLASAVIGLLLNTFWLTQILDKGFIVILPARILQAVLMIPVQFVSIAFLGRYVKYFKVRQ